ncbi:MAG TPA: TM2 domain-containing protein [Thermoanaerobaculia bacterium]|nr:TM2 domain-containing protein [Thermoanaerobaculia bacterium]
MTVSLAPVESFCRDCGSVIHTRAEICPKCGVRQKALPMAGTRSRVAAGILALFLGGIGAHKFYLGQPGLGIVYLLLVWTFVPAIVAVIEGIVYLCMSDAAFNTKYNAIP